MNLGWKLAATIQGRALADLLDSYQTERYPIGAQVLDWSRAQVLVMRPDSKARALNAILRDLMETRDGATYFAGRVWGVTTRYDLGGGHPLVGCSVPNFEFEDRVTVGELVRDGRGVLLDFGSNALLEAMARGYGDRVKFVSGRVKERLGLSAVLIRPDGFVVWACDNEPDEQSIRRAIARWFGSSVPKGQS
jgi:FAD binding domain